MSKEIIPAQQIALLIRQFRGEKVLLNFDLAMRYGVATKALNQAVKRNRERFPVDFMFQLATEEVRILRSQTVTSSELARKFSELERRVDKHDEEIAAILEAIRQLMVPPEKARREIGFHGRENTPRYRATKRA